MGKRKKLSVCCDPEKRKYETNSKKGRIIVEEIVYMHGVYEERGQRWWRGARVS